MRPIPNRASEARRKAESAALNDNMGKFRTGAHKNPKDKRANTRQAAVAKALRESGDE
jgi:hypothetical protein